MSQPNGLASGDPLPTRRSRLAAAAGQDFSLARAVGGPRGFIEAIAPGLLFVVWFGITHDLRQSLIAALAAAGLALVARVVTRGNVTQAIGGLIGVGVCAFVAARTGEARAFYLPGLLINIGYAVLYALSTVRTPAFRVGSRHVPRGPFPVLGLLIGPLVGEGLAWRHDPRRLRAYVAVTWMWVAMFVVRLAVQLPLFLADAVEALGVARLAMGVPLFALTAWMTWRVLRSVPAAKPAQPAAPTSP